MSMSHGLSCVCRRVTSIVQVQCGQASRIAIGLASRHLEDGEPVPAGAIFTAMSLPFRCVPVVLVVPDAGVGLGRRGVVGGRLLGLGGRAHLAGVEDHLAEGHLEPLAADGPVTRFMVTLVEVRVGPGCWASIQTGGPHRVFVERPGLSAGGGEGDRPRPRPRPSSPAPAGSRGSEGGRSTLCSVPIPTS